MLSTPLIILITLHISQCLSIFILKTQQINKNNNEYKRVFNSSFVYSSLILYGCPLRYIIINLLLDVGRIR